MRLATLKDIESIVQLQQIVYEQTNNNWLSTVSVEELEDAIGLHLAVLKEHDGSIVAFRMLALPANDYLGEHLNKNGNHIYYDISFVHPNYRGQKLQTLMGQWLKENVVIPGKYDAILSTVHPSNIPSQIDKFKLGMYVQSFGEFYGGKPRFVFVDPLQSIEWQEKEVHAESNNINAIRGYINEGYVIKNRVENYFILDLLVH